MQHRKIRFGFSVAPVIRAMQVPALAVALDGRVVELNTLAQESMGLSPAVIQNGLNIKHLLSRADGQQFLDFVAAASLGENTDGQAFAFHWQGNVATFLVSPLHDDDATLLGLLCQQTQQSLADELLTWRAALSSGDLGLWEIDVPSQTCTFSDDWYRMRGRTRAETQVTDLQSLYDRVHRDDQSRLQDGIMALFNGETDSFSIEFREIHANGHLIWILSRGRVLARDATGQPIRFVGTDTDITGNKTSQHLIEDLKQRELRWKVAVQSAEQGVWDHNFESGARFVSDTWRKMRGIGPEEIVKGTSETWLAGLHPGDLEHVQHELKRQVTGQTDTVNYQYRQRHKDGHWIWILSRGRVVRRKSDGSPARVIGTDTDITDIKVVELENAHMSERLRVAMRAADMGRWEFNLREGMAYWDDRLLEMFGVSGIGNHLPGNYWATLIHPADRERAVRVSDDSVARGVDLALEYRICRPDGRIVHVRSRAIFVADQKQGDRFVGVNIDITDDIRRQEELEAARALLEFESRHDALTGLSNRRGLDELQAKFFGDQKDQRQAVLHIDLDSFKQINDTLGHAAGDAVLVRAAAILRDKLRRNWQTARVGGDEFVMLLPDAPSHTDLAALSAEIIADMSAPFTYDGQPCNFGVSIGIAVSEPQQAPDKSLFAAADLALYAAKKDGRGKFRFFDIEMKESAAIRKNAFDTFLAGFEKGEIICHYQPQFDAKTLRLTGLEALVRWNSPTRGLIMPDAFLSTVEEMGMIAELDAMVLLRARDDLAKWMDAGFDVPRVSVNVSAARLADPELATALKEMNLPHGKFAFELLESIFLDSYADGIAVNLQALRDMGIEVEIDDFGTGHASIVSLLQVEPDRFKIDRQLIGPITHSTRQRNLIKTIIGIGQMQGVSVVAEGVETAKHAALLKTLGCDYLQGFALGRPVDFDRTLDLLSALKANHGRLVLAL